MKKRKKEVGRRFAKVDSEMVDRFVNFMAAITLAQANMKAIMSTAFFSSGSDRNLVYRFFQFWEKQEKKVVDMLYTDDETALAYENACAGQELLIERMAKLTPFHMHMISHFIDHMLDDSKEGLAVDFTGTVLEYQKMEVYMALANNLNKISVDDLKRYVFKIEDPNFNPVNYRVVGWTLGAEGGDRLDFEVVETGKVHKNTFLQNCPVQALLDLNNYIYLTVLENEKEIIQMDDTSKTPEKPTGQAVIGKVP